MDVNSRILIIGKGMIGGKITDLLIERGYINVQAAKHSDLELLKQNEVDEYFEKTRPEYVFFCAVATDDSDEFSGGNELYCNSLMQLHVVNAARLYGVKKMIMFGSAMLYPWNISIEELGYTEKQLDLFNITGYKLNMRPIVISKMLGLKLCQYYNVQYGTKFIYCIPTHIYGGLLDDKRLGFLENVVKEICLAKIKNKLELFLDIFGEGKAKKQFLHVNDCADAVIYIMEHNDIPEDACINVCGTEKSSWKDIVGTVCELLEYDGKVLFNVNHKEDMIDRFCSMDRLKKLGWKPKINLYEGLRLLCYEYMELLNSR